MSYQVLARKWRPKTFDELAGQEHVLKALVNALENQRLHHAYLFTGTRGVGKTTIARILARSLNCETGITPSPCGTCSACQEINDGRFVDLIEVDAASRTKVEDTRDLLENVQYRPTRGRFKIYLIDEVHMLSSHSFNALLKTLEEPPEHVKFLLATTDPQKLPVTVLSRCLQFNLKNLTSARIQEYLGFVLGEEKTPSEPEALWHLARAARGSMRDALSLTDQAISHGGGKLDELSVVAMLGTVDRKRIYDLMDALKEGDAKTLLDIAAQLAEFSPDYFALIEEILSLVHAVALYQHLPESGRSEDFDQEKLAGYANIFSPEDIQLIYQMLLLGQKDIAITPELHMGFEMLLLRLLAFQPLKVGERLPQDADTNGVQNDSNILDTPHESSYIPEGEGNPAKKPKAALADSQRETPPTQAIEEPLSEPSADREPSADKKPSADRKLSADRDPLENKESLTNKELLTNKEPSANKESSINKEPYASNDSDSEIIDFGLGESGSSHGSHEAQTSGIHSELSSIQNEPRRTNSAEQSIAQVLNESSDVPAAVENSNNSRASRIKHDLENSYSSSEIQEGFEEEKVNHPQSIDEIYAAYSSEAEVLTSVGEDRDNSASDAIDAIANPETPKIIQSITQLNRDNWIAVFNQLSISGMVRTLCSHLVLDSIQPEGPVFLLAVPGQKIFENTHKEKLVQAFSSYFGVEVNITVKSANVDQETPAEYADRCYRETLIKAEQDILQSPIVKEMVEIFDAQLVPDSVRLVNSDHR